MADIEEKDLSVEELEELSDVAKERVAGAHREAAEEHVDRADEIEEEK